MNKIIKLLKKDTNNLENIIYRKKYIGLTKVFIIYNETLVSSDKVSDFIIRSLDNITPFFVYHKIINNIDNFKYKVLRNYNEIDFYLNSGFSKAKEFVLDVALPYVKEDVIFLSDYKSYLQELVQTDRKSVTYNVIKDEGPSHDKYFEVEVVVDGIVYGKGSGKSKKEAEQNAAKNAIELSVGGNK